MFDTLSIGRREGKDGGDSALEGKQELSGGASSVSSLASGRNMHLMSNLFLFYGLFSVCCVVGSSGLCG